MKTVRPWVYSLSFASHRTGALDHSYRDFVAARHLLVTALGALALGIVYAPFFVGRGLVRAAVAVPLWLWRAAQYRRVGFRRLVLAVCSLMPCPACGAEVGTLCVGAELHTARHPSAPDLRAKLIAMFGPLYGEGWR